LHLVLDAAVLSAWVPSWMSLENKRRYFELGKRIREHKLGLYVVEHADIDVLRHVFDRVNSTGKPMRREEVFDALIGSQIAQDGSTGLALVNAQLADLGFGIIEPSTILKAFEAIRGDTVGKLDPRTLNLVDAEADLRRTATALRATVNFLRSTGRVPHVAVRPYELLIVVLARFFALHTRSSDRSLILLRRWLWRGSLGERLGGASSSMQQHVNDVTEAEADSVQAPATHRISRGSLARRRRMEQDDSRFHGERSRQGYGLCSPRCASAEPRDGGAARRVRVVS
jgi:hypothetical protein